MKNSLLKVLPLVLVLVSCGESGSHYPYLKVVFKNDEDKTCIVDGNKDYNITESNIIIPAKIDGYSVAEVTREAFYCKTVIDTVVVEEGVTGLDRYSFANCGLTSIVLPTTLTYLNEYALAGNSGIVINFRSSANNIKCVCNWSKMDTPYTVNFGYKGE